MRPASTSRPWFIIGLSALVFFAFRLCFGLFVASLQPVVDEIQTYLIGLKYYTTGAWPYYGNDVVAPWPPDHKLLLTQDPGALEAFIVGLPLKLWPNAMAPLVALNLFSLAGFGFLAYYGSKRTPRLPAWFTFTWVLIAPWCVHYSTSMINLSYTITIGCFFFVAWMETMPNFSLGWIPTNWANALMGLCLSAWFQLHRTWVLVIPFLALTFFLQWKNTKKPTGLLYFALAAVPLSLLIVPTLLQPDYHLNRDVSGFSYGFNFQNFKMGFAIMAQYLVMAGFEMPRFLGLHTSDRIHYLLSHPPLLVQGFFLWYFGISQPLIYIGYLFTTKNPHREWKWMKILLAGSFLLIFLCLCLTTKTPEINTYCELLPIPMLYSLYVWERWWTNRWGKRFLVFFLVCAVSFQVAYMFARLPLNESFYLASKDKIAQAIEQKDYHVLGERRSGALY